MKFGNFHITGIAYRVVFAMVLLSRGFQVALNSSIGKAMLGLTVFFGLSVPFSVWRSGSKDIFLNQWLTFSFVAFLAVAGLVQDYAQWFKLFKALTYALLVFTVIANVFGVSDNGRLFLVHDRDQVRTVRVSFLERVLGVKFCLVFQMNSCRAVRNNDAV